MTSFLIVLAIFGYLLGYKTSSITKNRRIRKLKKQLTTVSDASWNKGFTDGWDSATHDPITIAATYAEMFNRDPFPTA